MATHLLFVCRWCYFSIRWALLEARAGCRGAGRRRTGHRAALNTRDAFELRFQEAGEFGEVQVQGRRGRTLWAEPRVEEAQGVLRPWPEAEEGVSSATQDPSEASGRVWVRAEEGG